jgi:hypothetical protein
VILRKRELFVQHGESPGKVDDVGGLRPGEAVIERRSPLDVGNSHRRSLPATVPCGRDDAAGVVRRQQLGIRRVVTLGLLRKAH